MTRDACPWWLDISDWVRYRPAIAAMMLALIGVSTHFGWRIAYGDQPVKPEVYGDAALLVPALVWVGLQHTAAWVALIGTVIPHALRGAVVTLLGTTVLFLMFAVFAFNATPENEGTVLQSYAYGGVWICALVAAIALRYIIWKERA